MGGGEETLRLTTTAEAIKAVHDHHIKQLIAFKVDRDLAQARMIADPNDEGAAQDFAAFKMKAEMTERILDRLAKAFDEEVNPKPKKN